MSKIKWWDNMDFEDEEDYPAILGDEWFLPQMCPLGDKCLMLGLHTEDECHTAEDMEEDIKRWEKEAA